MFWKLKGSMKCKWFAWSSYKQRNNVYLLFLECELQHERYGWWIFELRYQKMVETRNLDSTADISRS